MAAAGLAGAPPSTTGWASLWAESAGAMLERAETAATQAAAVMAAPPNEDGTAMVGGNAPGAQVQLLREEEDGEL